jgi:hypothetical protein
MILMASIPWAVFWYEVHDFSGQMRVPLAVMLSMVAFQLSIAKDLPRVGYTTFLDAVFLTSFTFVFLCIVEIVFVYVLQVKKRTALAETIRRTARWGFPLAYAGCLALLVLRVLGGRACLAHEEGKGILENSQYPRPSVVRNAGIGGRAKRQHRGS